MNVVGIIVMSICYIVILIHLSLYIDKERGFKVFLFIPIIILGIGILNIDVATKSDKDNKDSKEQSEYEEVTEKLYRKKYDKIN